MYFKCLALHIAHRFSLIGVPVADESISAVLQPHASHFTSLAVSVSSFSSCCPGDTLSVCTFLGGVVGDLFIPRIFSSRDPCSDFSLINDGDVFGRAFREAFTGVDDALVAFTPNNGFIIEESTPLVPLVLPLLLPKPKPKPVDDVVLPVPAPVLVPAGAGDDARAAKPPPPAPLSKTGAFDPEPNIGAVFS